MKTIFALLVGCALAGSNYFWFVTDAHLQLDYKKGGDPANKCHGSGSTAGKYGDYDCNTPLVTAKSAAEFMISKSAEYRGFAG